MPEFYRDLWLNCFKILLANPLYHLYSGPSSVSQYIWFNKDKKISKCVYFSDFSCHSINLIDNLLVIT